MSLPPSGPFQFCENRFDFIFEGLLTNVTPFLERVSVFIIDSMGLLYRTNYTNLVLGRSTINDAS